MSRPSRPTSSPRAVRPARRDDRWALAATVALTALVVGCGQSRRASPEGDAGASFDAPVLTDATTDGSVALSVDFVVEGCASPAGRNGPCRGSAPLNVVFAPVLTGEFNRFLWDFGDGSPPSSLQTPAHVYDRAGRYDVSLVVGGPAGSLSRSRVGYVVVTTAGAGATCARDDQCAAGLHCLCGDAAAGCGAAFARGICTQACLGTPVPAASDGGVASPASDGGVALDDCGPRAVCVNLGLGRAPATAPWQGLLCLSRCRLDLDCPSGLTCRRFPGGPEGNGDWPSACFPPVPRELGAPCRAADGTLDDSVCTGGICADLGAFGLCSADCSATSCPSGATCASFADGRRLCLPGCSPARDGGASEAGVSASTCAADPLIACAVPRAAATASTASPLGFSVAADAGASPLCAPRGCRTDGDCAPAGRCLRGDAAEGACAWPGPSATADGGADGPRDAGAVIDAPAFDGPRDGAGAGGSAGGRGADAGSAGGSHAQGGATGTGGAGGSAQGTAGGSTGEGGSWGTSGGHGGPSPQDAGAGFGGSAGELTDGQVANDAAPGGPAPEDGGAGGALR